MILRSYFYFRYVKHTPPSQPNRDIPKPLPKIVILEPKPKPITRIIITAPRQTQSQSLINRRYINPSVLEQLDAGKIIDVLEFNDNEVVKDIAVIHQTPHIIMNESDDDDDDYMMMMMKILKIQYQIMKKMQNYHMIIMMNKQNQILMSTL